MIHLFIDTNIWLSLYHFSDDDLAEFEKLKDHLNTSITLYFTEQVKEEITRNREAKIKDALKTFDMKAMQYPAFSKGFPNYKQFSVDYQTLLSEFKKWRKNIDDCIATNTLPADNTIKVILASVTCIPCEEFVDRAVIRYKKGNPPGKDNKYGDAINWECLLQSVPDNEDLYFISLDKDYQSLLYKDKMDPFLIQEWKEIKNADIHFYTSLTAFLRDHVHDIELATENEKQQLIERLSFSHNFISTHGIIAMLNKYTGWTEAQIEDICDAAENNSQVKWILDDEDVKEFYNAILSNVDYSSLSDGATKRIIDLLRKGESQNTEDENASEDKL